MDSRLDTDELLEKVELYIGVRKFDAAEKLLKSSISELGELPNLYNQLGLIYVHQSRFQNAIESFHRALRINPDYAEAGQNLSAILCDLGKYDDAREIYRSLPTSSKTHKSLPSLVLGRLANQHRKSGDMYVDAGELSSAITEYKKAIELYPEMPDVLYSLSTLYFRLGFIKKSEESLKTLLDYDAEHIQANTLLGIIYAQHGQTELAKSRWEASHKKHPSNRIVRAFHHFSKSI